MLKKNWKKVFTIFICLAFGLCLLAGCADNQPAQASPEESISTDEAKVTQEPQNTSTPTAEPTVEAQPSEEVNDELPKDVMPLDLAFSSGAGGWATTITINSDGSFEGTYSDSDMGSQGEGYPKGTVYICEFSGKFSDVEKIDDYSYSMTLSELNIDTAHDEEWIENQVKYVPSDPYGLESGKDFILYTPETPLDGLSEDFLSWWPGRFSVDENLETLSYYGLYNKETGYGFFGI